MRAEEGAHGVFARGTAAETVLGDAGTCELGTSGVVWGRLHDAGAVCCFFPERGAVVLEAVGAEVCVVDAGHEFGGDDGVPGRGQLSGTILAERSTHVSTFSPKRWILERTTLDDTGMGASSASSPGPSGKDVVPACASGRGSLISNTAFARLLGGDTSL